MSEGESAAGRPVRIGEWSFVPGAALLTRGGEKVRLQHRTAMVLEALVRRAGEPVSAQALISEIWDGRALSQNSVAVVIADLRRALGDDSRQPRFIETIPKRGYRLLLAPAEEQPAEAVEVEPGATSPAPRRLLPILAIAAAAVLAVGLWLLLPGQPDAVRVTVAPIENATGSAEHSPLAAAVTEVVATEVQRVPGIELVRDGAADEVDGVIRGRLVLWNGTPSVSLAATDPSSGATWWSTMAPGPAAMLPAQLEERIAGLKAPVDERLGRIDKEAAQP